MEDKYASFQKHIIMKDYLLKHIGNPVFIITCLIVIGLSSCNKDDYYTDGGKADPKFNGNVLNYLESKPVDFDTIAQVIKIAGLESTFANEEITFFAPNDRFIKQVIRRLNPDLRARYLDTIKTLTDIRPVIWEKYLMRYVFKGKYKLADFPQIDFELLNTFPGQNYFSYNSTVFNIGVIYNSANGVKYIGYRELAFNFIPDISKPMEGWNRAYVSSSDIQPNNGVVHALAYTGVDFGFNYSDFFQDVVLSKL